MKEVKLRKAKLADRFAVSQLTGKYPDTLNRSPKEISRMVGNFWVAENERGKIVGCCGAKMWTGDAEIISWIIEKKYQGSGLGEKILHVLLEDLKKRKRVRNIFAVTVPTLAKKYFKSLGFRRTGLQMFSAKVVEDCKHCPKNRFKNGRYQCNEIALVLRK